MDRSLSDLVQYLDKQKLLDNTILVVTADHGESLGEHHLSGHGDSLYVEEIHVPLILRFPQSIPAGVRVRTAISQTSLPATLVELAGGWGETQMPGLSLSELWKDSSAASNWPAPRAELRFRPTRHADRIALSSIIDFPWHFVKSSNGDDELFNLDRDPAETRNVANLAEYAEVVAKYRLEIESAEPAVVPVAQGRVARMVYPTRDHP